MRRIVGRLLRVPAATIDGAGDLFDKGIDLAEAGRTSEAFSIAKELERYGYTGAHEVEAVALHAEGRTDEAMEALRRGLGNKGVWRLGHLLGIYLSDAERYDEALAVLDDSLKMYRPQPVSTAYNKAIVLDRAGRTAQAVSLLQQVTASDAGEEVEAMNLAKEFLHRLTKPSSPQPRQRRSTKQRAARRRR